MKKILKIGYNLIMVVLVLFLIAVAGTFLRIPGNYKIFTVMSGSMEPKLKVGSLIFVKPAADYNVGDIISFKSGKNTVTHRLVEKKESDGQVTYLTKGDANNDVDPEATSKTNVVGKTFFNLPYVGYPIGYARTRTGFILLVIIPSTIIIYEELYKIKAEISKKWASRRGKKEKVAVQENMEERIRIIESEQEVSLASQRRSVARPENPPRRKIV
jgi:signal peptidase I